MKAMIHCRRSGLKSLALAALCAVGANSSKAQDIHFSQFYETSILRNPALTGIFSGDYKAGVNYRSQWGNISVPFQTLMASAETRIPINEDVNDYVSVGLVTTYDRAGSISFNSLQVYPAINYNKAIEDKHQSYLSAGFTAGYIQRSIDPNKVTTSEQFQGGSFNPNNGTGENLSNTTLNYLDVGAGVSMNSSVGSRNNINYYLGVAAYHLNKPKQAFNRGEGFLRTNTKWNGNLGVQAHITDQYAVTIHGNYSRQGSYTETLLGGLASFRSVDASHKTTFTLYAGAFYRFNDAIIPTMKLDYKTYSFTLSYDVNTSSLKSLTNGAGGFEISIFTRGELSKGLWKKDNTRCPRFEMMLPNF